MKKWMFMKELGYIYLLDSNMFLYIYLTLAFGFDWTVGDISLGIKRTLIVVLSRGGHVCSGWRDIPKQSCIFFQEKLKKKKEERVTVAELKKISQCI